MAKFVDSFDDIVFEFRNKTYGAYELRKKYPKRGTIALLISLVILGTAVGVPLMASIMNQRAHDAYIEKTVSSEMTNIEKVEEDQTPPPPPPPPPPAVAAVKFEALEIVDSITEPEVVLATIDDMKDAANTAPVDTTEEVVIVEEAPVVEQVFEAFEIQEQPSFPGGEPGLKKYIAENIKYPTDALENNIQGAVYIRFVVTSSGYVGEAKVLRSVDELLDKEALRIVKALPKWSPGKQNGKPISVWFIVPIKFVLQ